MRFAAAASSRLAAERVARIRRIGDDAAVAQDLGRLPDQPRLRMRGVDGEELGHGRGVCDIRIYNCRRILPLGYNAVNLQQLKYLCAVVDHGLNVSDAAEALFTSQPGISKQIRQLEDELGLSVFVRQGKRLASLTPAGEIVIATARRALREIANLKRVADEFRGEDTGTLSIATTHTQARYVLPKVLARVRDALPEGQDRPASGQPDAGRGTDGARRRRHRHRDRGARRFSRARHAAVLRMESRRAGSQAPSAGEDRSR